MTTTAWKPPESQFWLRDEFPPEPVVFDETTGLWNVYSYAEITRIFSDPTTFSSDTTRVIPESNKFAEGNLVRMDPPEHNKLRKLVSHAFTPKVVADLEPRIRDLTNELLDDVEGRLELVSDLAYPLPVTVIAELLGVPSSDRHLFKRWVDGMFEGTSQFSLRNRTEEQQRDFDKRIDLVDELIDYLREHIRERRRHPRADLLTKLVEADVDGHRLTEGEVANFGLVLLVAGHITTTMLLGNSVLCLDAHPDIQARTRADRSLIPGVIEESLRFLSPFAATSRVTSTETQIAGRTVGPDQMLLLWLAVANRDPQQFTDPGIFDPMRDPNPHIAFGRGVHFCLGAPLARLEGRVALNILLDRFPTLRTDPADQPEFMEIPNMTGVRKLPLLVDPSLMD